VAHKILLRRNLATAVLKSSKFTSQKINKWATSRNCHEFHQQPPSPPKKNYYFKYAGHLGDKNVVVCRNLITQFRLNIILKSNMIREYIRT
jgi:hypothetical protein